MRIGSLGTMVLLTLAAGGPHRAAAAQPPPPPAPQILSVTHDARTPLSAGRRLTVRLRGTPGGTARFHIAGVATGMGMRRISSPDAQTSTYVGTYVIRPGDAAPLAAVTATLRVGDRELVAASDRPVAIDARPPDVAAPLPLAGARLTNLRPNIVLRFFDGESSVDPAAVKLLINGRDVTRRTAITPTFAVYTPERAFRPGPVRVQAIVRDRAGNTRRMDWSFTVALPQGLITSVTVSSATGLKPGDYLTVVMTGVPAGRASLAVGGASNSIAMRESPHTPGTYVGMYPVGFKHQGSIIQVTAHLRRGPRSSTATAIAPVPVMGRTPRPSVAPPQTVIAADDQTIEQITVTGRARPGYRVVTLLSARMESPKGSAWTPLLAAYASTKQDGTWRLALGPVVPRARAALFLTVVAVDPLGQRSPPVTVALGATTGAREAVVAPEGASGPPTVPGPQPSPSTQPSPASPSVSSPPQPAPSMQPPPPKQPAPSQPPGAPRRPQCPPGQVIDPKTDQCVPEQPGGASGEKQGGASPAPPATPPAEPPASLTPSPGLSDPKPKDRPNGPKTGSPNGPNTQPPEDSAGDEPQGSIEAVIERVLEFITGGK